PVVERRGGQIDVLAPELLGEPLDRGAVEHLADRELREQARRRHAARNRLWRLGRRRGDDHLAAAAAVLVDPLLEEVDVGRLVDEARAGVETHLAQRLGAARAQGHLGVRELDLVDLAAHATSAPLTLGARGPPAGRAVVVGSEVVAAGWRVVLARRS